MLVGAMLLLTACKEDAPTQYELEAALPEGAELVVKARLENDTATTMVYAFMWDGYLCALAPVEAKSMLPSDGSDSFLALDDGHRMAVVGPVTSKEKKTLQPKVEKWFTQAEGATPHFSGATLIDVLRSNPSTRTMLLAAGMMFDAEMVIKSIEGEVDITVRQKGEDDYSLTFEADVNNTDFMQNVEDWNGGLSEEWGLSFTKREGENDYYDFQWQDFRLSFGIVKGRLRIEGEVKDKISQLKEWIE